MNRKQFGLLFILFCSTTFADAQLWKEYADSAKVFAGKKNIDTAILFYVKSKLELLKDSAGTANYAQLAHALGSLYYQEEKYDKAEIQLLEAKQIREKIFGKGHLDFISSCEMLAYVYDDMDKYEKAETLYLDVRALRQKLLGKEHTHYANACNNLALLYRHMGQYEKAETLFIESQNIHEKKVGKEHKDYADACNNLAILYRYMGQYEKAEPLYITAKHIREKTIGKENLVYANACHNLASLYRYMGQYEKAELLYIESNAIRRKILGEGHRDNAKADNNLANLYSDMGQYAKAELLLLNVKKIYEKKLGKENLEYAASCTNLAALYKDLGQYEKVNALLREDNEIQIKLVGKNHPSFALSCASLAISYKLLGQYEKAENLILQSMQIQEKILGKDHPDYAYSCSQLAGLYNQNENYEKAKPLYLEAMKIQEKAVGKKHPDYANACTNLADFYKNEGEYEKAKELYIEAKNIREKSFGKLHPDYGQSCNNLGTVYWLLNQPLLAAQAFKESFLVSAHNLQSVFQFTNEKEKAAFVKNILEEDGNVYSFYRSQKTASGHPYALALFHRNLILSSSQALKKQLLITNDSIVSNKYNEWMGLKKYLAIIYSMPFNSRKENVSEMEEKVGLLEKELARNIPAFKLQEKKERITWQNIQQNLKMGECAIEFAEFKYYNGKNYTDSNYYVALILKKGAPAPEMIELFEKKQLDSILNYKSTSAGKIKLSFLYTKQDVKIKTLYDIIWKPIEQKLAGIKKIFFAPAGSLHKIAFAALPVNDHEVLSDKYHLVQLSTTASVMDTVKTSIETSDKTILYGGILYDADSTSIRRAAIKYVTSDIASRSLPDDLSRDGAGEFYYLSGSESEVKSIGNIASENKYSVAIADGMFATEESFKELTGKNSPAILHIATHGFFFPDPKNSKRDATTSGAIVFKQSDNPLIRSGLAMTGANNTWKGNPVPDVEDGILTSYEVSNMYLPNTKLAVLSACETGLGDIQGSEGVYGLQRAFKIAGAQNLIMSLWKVDDLATAEFMKEFYKNLFSKQTISDAFYNAQTIMKNKYRTDPYKWAAWILIR